MLVEGGVGREEPLLAERIFGFGLGEERVDAAPGVGIDDEPPFAFGVLLEQVAQIGVGVTRACAEFQSVAQPLPACHGPQRAFVLGILLLFAFVAVGREHRQSAVRVEVPCRQRETVAAARGVIKLLHDVQVAESAVAVALQGVIFADDLAVVVGDELFRVVVAEAEIIVRGAVEHARRTAPPRASVGQVQEFVERGERPDALHVTQPQSLLRGGFGRQRHRAAQPAAGDAHRAGSVIDRRVVDEIGGYQRKIDLSEHRRIDLHVVPRHLRVRGRRAAERGGRERCAAVGFDEDGRTRRQGVGQRCGDVFAQDERVQLGALYADLLHRAASRNIDRLDGDGAGRRVTLRRGGQGAGQAEEYRRGAQHAVSCVWLRSGSSRCRTLRSKSRRSAGLWRSRPSAP